MTWRQLDKESEQLAQILSSRLPKTQKQLVIGLLMPNCWQLVVTYLAILKLGHIALPLDASYKSLELKAIVKQINPALIITDREYAARLHGDKKLVILEDLKADSRPVFKPLRLPSKQQIASLVFTSGTTGKPKAVPNTHANHTWNIKACSQRWNWTEADTLLVSTPLSHMLGIVMGLSGAIYHGNTLYLHRWFDEVETLKTLSSGKISFFSHAASAYVKLAQAPGDYDLSSVRLCVSGAAPLPPAVWQKFKQRFGVEILETYGTSETGRIAGNHLEERVLGSPGQPLPGVETKLNDEGELLVRSDGIFPGYWRNEQATRQALTDDGWWHTGDIAELDDGRIVLKGRKQERIRRYGYTVSPRDVEWALHQHPQVNDVHVMGMQRPGEPNDKLVFFIVGELDPKHVDTYCKSDLPMAWRPDQVIILDSLPRTHSGKPRLTSLRGLAEARL